MEERLDKRIVRGYRPWIYTRPSFSSAPPRMCMSILRAAKYCPPVIRSPWACVLNRCRVYRQVRWHRETADQQQPWEGVRISLMFVSFRISSFEYLKAVQQTRDATCRCLQRSRPCTAHASTPAPPAPHPSIVRSRRLRLRLHLASGSSRMSQSASM